MHAVAAQLAALPAAAVSLGHRPYRRDPVPVPAPVPVPIVSRFDHRCSAIRKLAP